MILHHSHYKGQLNVPDMFTRLVVSLAATGIAPASFYRPGSDGQLQTHPYTGVTVDCLADVMNGISRAQEEGYHTYHTFNPRTDVSSLDDIVEFIASCGIKMQRIPDHQDWFTRFSTACRALPDHVRQHSALPILEVFAVPGGIVGNNFPEPKAFTQKLRQLSLLGDKPMPGLSKGLIEKFIEDLKYLKLA